MDAWSATWATRNLIAEFLMPPGIWLLFIFITLLWIKKVWLKNSLIIFALLGIWLTATNFFAVTLVQVSDRWMKWPQPPSWTILEKEVKDHASKKQAIVVLGGGRRRGALEMSHYQHQDVSSATLDRLRVAVALAKRTQLPILVSGGAPDRMSADELTEAELMVMILKNEFSVQATWVEMKSNNTHENSQESLEILRTYSIERIYLVTDFLHIPRAQRAFEKCIFKQEVKIEIIPVPSSYFVPEKYSVSDFFPQSLTRVRRVAKEIIGNLLYQLRYRLI